MYGARTMKRKPTENRIAYEANKKVYVYSEVDLGWIATIFEQQFR